MFRKLGEALGFNSDRKRANTRQAQMNAVRSNGRTVSMSYQLEQDNRSEWEVMLDTANEMIDEGLESLSSTVSSISSWVSDKANAVLDAVSSKWSALKEMTLTNSVSYNETLDNQFEVSNSFSSTTSSGNNNGLNEEEYYHPGLISIQDGVGAVVVNKSETHLHFFKKVHTSEHFDYDDFETSGTVLGTFSLPYGETDISKAEQISSSEFSEFPQGKVDVKNAVAEPVSFDGMSSLIDIANPVNFAGMSKLINLVDIESSRVTNREFESICGEYPFMANSRIFKERMLGKFEGLDSYDASDLKTLFGKLHSSLCLRFANASSNDVTRLLFAFVKTKDFQQFLSDKRSSLANLEDESLKAGDRLENESGRVGVEGFEEHSREDDIKGNSQVSKVTTVSALFRVIRFTFDNKGMASPYSGFVSYLGANNGIVAEKSISVIALINRLLPDLDKVYVDDFENDTNVVQFFDNLNKGLTQLGISNILASDLINRFVKTDRFINKLNESRFNALIESANKLKDDERYDAAIAKFQEARSFVDDSRIDNWIENCVPVVEVEPYVPSSIVSLSDLPVNPEIEDDKFEPVNDSKEFESDFSVGPDQFDQFFQGSEGSGISTLEEISSNTLKRELEEARSENENLRKLNKTLLEEQDLLVFEVERLSFKLGESEIAFEELMTGYDLLKDENMSLRAKLPQTSVTFDSSHNDEDDVRIQGFTLSPDDSGERLPVTLNSEDSPITDEFPELDELRTTNELNRVDQEGGVGIGEESDTDVKWSPNVFEEDEFPQDLNEAVVEIAAVVEDFGLRETLSLTKKSEPKLNGFVRNGNGTDVGIMPLNYIPSNKK